MCVLCASDLRAAGRRRSLFGAYGRELTRSRGQAKRGHGEKNMRDWVLAEQTHAFIRAHQWQTAVLPFGATEPHNLHMPYGTDNFQVDVIGERACARAYAAG